MSALIVPLELPPRREPLTVTALRQQIRRGASLAVLQRIAGSAPELLRLRREYGLAVTAPSEPKAPPAAAPDMRPPGKEERAADRRARLLRLIEQTAAGGLVFPSARELAGLFGWPEYLAQTEMRRLVREGLIRVAVFWLGNEQVRRIHLVKTGQATALPPGVRPSGRRQ